MPRSRTVLTATIALALATTMATPAGASPDGDVKTGSPSWLPVAGDFGLD